MEESLFFSLSFFLFFFLVEECINAYDFIDFCLSLMNKCGGISLKLIKSSAIFRRFNRLDRLFGCFRSVNVLVYDWLT